MKSFIQSDFQIGGYPSHLLPSYTLKPPMKDFLPQSFLHNKEMKQSWIVILEVLELTISNSLGTGPTTGSDSASNFNLVFII